MSEINHNQILAEAAARHLRDTGAKNYTGAVFAITFDTDGEQIEVLVTTQKVGAPTPHDLRLQAEAELAALREETANQHPDSVLCDFYEVTDYSGLVRELVGHVSQLQESAKRNVKPWEDTFPPTLLPAYIERVSAANTAVQPQAEPGACDWLLVSHPSGTEWTVKRGSKEYDRAFRANHLTITPLTAGVEQSAPVAVALQERTPKDYAIEHAEYMAKSADDVLAKFQAYGLALLAVDEGGDDDEGELFEAIDTARDDLQESLVDLRGMVYEFRKRRARIDAIGPDAEA